MKRRQAAKALLFLALVLTMLAAADIDYDAQEDAIAAMAQGETKGGVTAFVPEDAKAGLIFYPGGLVDHAAYAPLMEELRARGVLCLLLRMPLDLAVLDVNAADGLIEAYPEVSRWLIGGHSLGGAMAADYAAKHAGEFEGLVLLGAYSAADLSATALSVLSIFGSEDGVLNREKYEKNRVHYPERFTELVISGGNHAQFGSYGAQRGDGTAQISAQEQRRRTADAILQMLGT